MWLNKEKKLNGVNVWISGAVPEKDMWPHPLYDRDILTFVAQLSRLVLKKGGVLIHGSHPSFTPILVNQHFQITPKSPERLQLFVSDFFGTEIKDKYADSCQVNLIPKSSSHDNKPNIDKSLTALRHEMAKRADIMVVLGGKLHKDSAREPGVFEEIRIANEYDVQSFILPYFKGATQFLEEKYPKIKVDLKETDLDYLAHALVRKIEKDFSVSKRILRKAKNLFKSLVNN